MSLKFWKGWRRLGKSGNSDMLKAEILEPRITPNYTNGEEQGSAWQAKMPLPNQTLWQASLPTSLFLNRPLAPQVALLGRL